MQSSRTSTPLHLASGSGHIDLVRLLLERGADVEARDEDGRTAYQLTVRRGMVEISELLSKHGVHGEKR